jgi:hypothetical protein
MTFSHVVDTLIAVVAIFVAGAAAASFLQECLAALTQYRGRKLYGGILNLVCGWESLVERMYRHPLIECASTSTGAKNRPSYIDPRNFSLAFWQCLNDQLADQTSAAAAPTSATAWLGELRARLAAPGPQAVQIKALEPILNALLVQAGDDYQRLLTLTDAWYNRQMDRVAGWYRRWSQWWLVGIGLALALAFNINTVHVVSRMNADPLLTQSVDSAIVKQYRGESAVGSGTGDAASAAQALDSAMRNADVPIDAFIATTPTDLFAVIRHPGRDEPWALLGIAITGFAFAFGAPFWFDLLAKLVNVRMAGTKPDTSAK